MSADASASPPRSCAGRERRSVYLRGIFVPEESCLLLCDADAVREAAGRAAVEFERVAEAVPEALS